MNERCLSLLNRLIAQEYYDFLKMALGMHAFQHGKKISHGRVIFMPISNAKLDANDNKDKQNPLYLAIMGIDNKNQTFRDAKGNIYKTSIFFEGMDEDLLECILRTAKSNLDWAELLPSDSLYPSDALYPSGEVFNPNFGRTVLNDYLDSKRSFQFILVSGINAGYGIGVWNDLLESMDAFVKKRQRISNDKKSNKNYADFKGRLVNTNYIGPQLAENIDREEYFKILHNWLYNESSEAFNSRESTNLYQVVMIASSKEQCSVLTFNYDDVFELLAKSEFPENTWTTVYLGMTKAKEEKKRIIQFFIFMVFCHGRERLQRQCRTALYCLLWNICWHIGLGECSAIAI